MTINYMKNYAIRRYLNLITGPQFLVYCALALLFSCNKSSDSKHFTEASTLELDGLVQPANQTVLSKISTIRPVQLTLEPFQEVTGIITYDPRLISIIPTRFGGRVEKLYVHFNFENVLKGQRIMDIYSPDIVTAQMEFIQQLGNSISDSSLINSCRNKLLLLGLNSVQLNTIERDMKVLNPLPIYSPYSGHIHDIGISSGSTQASMNGTQGMSGSPSVILPEQIENLPGSQNSALSLKEGMYIQSGESVFEVYNTHRVWSVLNLFPEKSKTIKLGDKVLLNLETEPSNEIISTVDFIEPVTGKNASTIKLRVYIQQEQNSRITIGTLVSAKIFSDKISGIWLSRNAVVNLGQKQVVFQKMNNHFSAKSIETGFWTDTLIQVVKGLDLNAEVASNAQYLVDSESFIETDDDGK